MSGEDQIPPPPPGFAAAETMGEFSQHNGPFFRRAEGYGPGVAQALFILPRHTNGLGVLHGGMLSSFLDSTLGLAVRHASGRWAITVQLSIDFMRMARRGEWLVGEGSMTHLSGDTAFAEGRAMIGDKIVGRATGVFRLMRRPL